MNIKVRMFDPFVLFLVLAILLSCVSGCMHQHQYKETVIQPTCTEAGYTVFTCACGEEYTDCVTEALGHVIKETVINDATCTENGLKESYCTRCDWTNEVIITAEGHRYLPWQDVDEPTCEHDGLEKHTCEICGYEETRCVEALGHNIGEWVEVSKLTCETNEYSYRQCSRCDYKEEHTVETRGHDWSSWKTTKEPTCSSKGQKERRCTCSSCGKVETEAIGKTSHNYVNGYCTRCNAEDANHYPKVYEDAGVKITIYKITGYGGGNTTCYVADVQLTDYSRFFTACGKNKYGGQSGTQAAAKLQNAVLAINGCYSAPYLDYTVVRRGVIYNGANRNLCLPAVYSSKTGLFSNVWEGQRNDLAGKKVQDLVDAGLVTDTFCFGPPILVDGVVTGGTSGGRAQRTFIGTDGKPGHLLLCVSNGRYSDGVSAGLTYKEMGQLMKDYGCNFGIPLDGGGSSTMVFKGQVLNQLANGQERTWIVDFCCVSNP